MRASNHPLSASTNTTLRELLTDDKEANNSALKDETAPLTEHTQHGYYCAGDLKTLERTLRTSTFDTVLSFFKLLQVRI